METYDISAVQADDDADTLVFTTAIDAVKTCDVIIIGEDKDILVLLLHYYNLDLPFTLFYKRQDHEGKTNLGYTWSKNETT